MKNSYGTQVLPLIVTMLTAIAGHAPAQRTNSGKVVRLILVSELPAGYGNSAPLAVVFRGPSTGDVVVVEQSRATPELVDAATKMLLRSRLLDGTNPTARKGKSFNMMTLAVRTVAAPSADWMSRFGQQLQQLINTAAKAPVTNVPHIGKGRVVEFYLPRI